MQCTGMSEKDKKRSFWRNEGALLLALAGIIGGAVLLGVFVKLGMLLVALVDNVNLKGDAAGAIRGVGWLFSALFGGIVAVVFGVWRGWIAEKQTTVARDQYERSLDRDYADLFTKAVEQLGTDKVVKRPAKDAQGKPVFDENGRAVMDEVTEPNIEVRLGAIYALQRISQDSERDHIAVMETLCAYVRENAPVDTCEAFPVTLLSGHKNDPLRMTIDWGKAWGWWRRIFLSALRAWIGTLDAPRADVQAVVTVLGRRRAERIRHEVGADANKPRYRLDLRRANLRKADLREGNFRNALLSGAHMEGADLDSTHMEGANLNSAHMEGAHLKIAHMEGAYLLSAHMEGAYLFSAHMEGAHLEIAHMEGAYLNSAHMEGAYLFSAHMEGAHLSSAHMEGVDLFRAHMEGAYLNSTHMEGAHLFSAHLKSAKLAMVHIDSAMASYADFTDAKDLSREAVESCFGCAGTILPEYLDRPRHWHPERLENGDKRSKAYKTWKTARAAGERPVWVAEEDWTGW